MIDIPQACNCVLGPYKTYVGNAEYDNQANLFHGEVIGTRDVITFQGETMPELVVAFKKSIDDYLQFCKQRGERAERPFSGKFVARINPEIHRQISMLAQAEGKSLNQFVCDRLQSIAEEGQATGARTRRPKRYVAAKLSTSARTSTRVYRAQRKKAASRIRRSTSRHKQHS